MFTIPFGGDVSGCVATANPTAPTADTDMPLIVTTAGNPSRVVVTQQDASAPYPFALQVIC